MAIVRVRKGRLPGSVHAIHDCRQPNWIGRDPSNHVHLEDEKSSRRHCQIFREFGIWFIEDLGSRNGTVLQGKPIQRAPLEDGMLLQVGGTLLAFHENELCAPPSGEVCGTRLLTTIREETGVSVYRAFQAALDREVRVDQLAPNRDYGDRVLAAVKHAVEEAQKVEHPGVDGLVLARLERDRDHAVILRCRQGESFDSELGRVLAQPLPIRLRVFRELVGALLNRAVWESLRSPVALRQITVTKMPDGSYSASIPAVDLAALVTERSGNICHLPHYVPYLAPELTSEDPASATIAFSSTMYNLGALGYHILSGKLPMGNEGVRKTLENHRDLQPAPPNLLDPTIPDDVSALLLRMLAKNPGERPPGRLDVVGLLQTAEKQLLRTTAPPEAPRVEPEAAVGSRPRASPGPTAPAPTASRRLRKPSGERLTARERSPQRKRLPVAVTLSLWLVFWVALFVATRYLSSFLFSRLKQE